MEHVDYMIDKLAKDKRQHTQEFHEGWQKALKVVPHHLTEVELDFIREEYRNLSHNQQIKKIDEILRQLQFFNNMQKEIRYAFYKHASYLKTSKGHYIVKNGNYGDHLYVILRGKLSKIEITWF